jgi:hypothetical protein
VGPVLDPRCTVCTADAVHRLAFEQAFLRYEQGDIAYRVAVQAGAKFLYRAALRHRTHWKRASLMPWQQQIEQRVSRIERELAART